jgi:hypothetical protein
MIVLSDGGKNSVHCPHVTSHLQREITARSGKSVDDHP